MPMMPSSVAMTILLGLTIGLAPLATDMYLPTLPAIAAYFDAPAAGAQVTLSAFMLGFAGGQIIFGPISDRIGRRPVLLGGYAAFVLTTMVCALAPSLEVLVVARFFQAIAASAPFVLARAVVRDMHGPVEAARQLGMMHIVSGAVPTIAPAFGGLIAMLFDWRIQFVVMAIFGVVNFLWIYLGLQETLRQRAEEPLSIGSIVRSLAKVWENRAFRVYATLICLAFSGMFTIISAAPFVLQQIYGLSEIGFGLTFGTTTGSFIISSMVGIRIVRRRGIDGVLAFGVSGLALGGLILSAAVLFQLGFIGIVAGMMVFGLGMGMTFPPATAGCLAPFPERSGAASSLSGFLQMAVAAVVGVVVGLMVGSSAWPLAGPICLFGVASVIVFLITGRIRREGGYSAPTAEA